MIFYSSFLCSKKLISSSFPPYDFRNKIHFLVFWNIFKIKVKKENYDNILEPTLKTDQSVGKTSGFLNMYSFHLWASNKRHLSDLVTRFNDENIY